MGSKFIKPRIFNADPNSKQESKEWRHWYCTRTFSNFVDSFPAEPAISDEDKLKCLIAHISKGVYDYVSECCTYQEAIQTLERLLQKTLQHHFCETFTDDMQAAASTVVR